MTAAGATLRPDPTQPRDRRTIRLAVVALVCGWGWAATYALRRTAISEGFTERTVLGRQQYSPDEVEIVVRALDLSLIAWVVLPLLLLGAALTTTYVGVGHVVLITAAVANTPVLPLFGVFVPLDPLLGVLAVAHGTAAAAVVVSFLRNLMAHR